MITEINPEYWLRLQRALQAKIQEMKNSGGLMNQGHLRTQTTVRRVTKQSNQHAKALLADGQGGKLDLWL